MAQPCHSLQAKLHVILAMSLPLPLQTNAAYLCYHDVNTPLIHCVTQKGDI